MGKATLAGIAMINYLLDKKYKDSSVIPAKEREAAIELAWPSKKRKTESTNLEDMYQWFRQNSQTATDAIVQMYRAGYTSVDITKGMHGNKAEVLSILHAHGLANRKKNVYRDFIEPNLDLIKELTGKGYNRDRAAEAIGIRRNQLTSARKEHPKLARVLDEGDEIWKEHKATLREETLKERINNE